MLTNLNKYKIILGSNSPRRKELLTGLDINFEVKPMVDIDESYPDTLQPEDIPIYIANKKTEAYRPTLKDNKLLITADTIVWINNQVLEKPKDREDAIRMLKTLSGNTHKVITGVCLTTQNKSTSFSVVSTVRFAPIKEEDIIYYIDTYQPYDKAGAYGVQEWIGYVAVEEINGSFYNVMGLPIQRVYQELSKF